MITVLQNVPPGERETIVSCSFGEARLERLSCIFWAHQHNGTFSNPHLFATVFVKVLKYPHPLLKYKCNPLQKINQELRDIVGEMFDIMYASDGVGLAASQVGLPFRLFVMNPTGKKEEKAEEYVFINPVILKKSGSVTDSEGCLSFPDIHADVVRAETIEVEAISLAGEEQRFKWNDRRARIVQHEIDHLNGTCFVDRIAATAQIEIKSELDDMSTVFEGDQRLGFAPIEAAIRTWEEYAKKFC